MVHPRYKYYIELIIFWVQWSRHFVVVGIMKVWLIRKDYIFPSALDDWLVDWCVVLSFDWLVSWGLLICW